MNLKFKDLIVILLLMGVFFIILVKVDKLNLNGDNPEKRLPNVENNNICNNIPKKDIDRIKKQKCFSPIFNDTINKQIDTLQILQHINQNLIKIIEIYEENNITKN